MTPVEYLEKRFKNLSQKNRIQIAVELDLVDVDEDVDLPVGNLFDCVYDRAKNMDMIPILWEAVESFYFDRAESNPFTHKGNQ